MKYQNVRRRVQFCALGVVVLVPSVLANLFGVYPFGAGIYMGCVALGLPVYFMLPVYLGVGILINPSLARIVELLVSGLVGALATVPLMRRKSILFPLFVISQLGRLYEILMGGSPWQVLPAVGLGACALLAMLCTTAQPPCRAVGFCGVIAVVASGLHTVPFVGAAVFGLFGLCVVRLGKSSSAATVSYAAGALLATFDEKLALMYVLVAGAALLANHNRFTAAAAFIATTAVYAFLFSVPWTTGVAVGAGVAVGLTIPVKRRVEAELGTTELLPVLRKMAVAKEALKSARIVLDEVHTDEGALAIKLGTKLCEGCKECSTCSVSEESFVTGMRRALNRGRAGLDLLPDEIVEQCSRAAQVPLITAELLRGVEQETEKAQVRAAAAQMAASELQAFSTLIEGWLGEAKTPLFADEELRRVALAKIQAHGGKLLSFVGSGKGLQIVAQGVKAEDILTAVNSGRKRKFSVDCVTKLENKTEFYLLPSPRLGVVYGAAQTAKQGACGDVYFVKKLNAVTVLAVLCDGMGSGRSAHDLSERTISLMEACFAAGFDTTHVLGFVNSLLTLAGERFSCVDLCLIDLERKEASFVKAGGVESYILRGEHRVCIEGGALPLGVEDRAATAATTVDLEEGDVIVMVTDGVSDCVDPFPKSLSNPQAAADEILTAAVDADSGRPHDDMTALVLRTVA